MSKQKNLSILITAGPTQEAIDPVRYLSNHSSGKMGFALAEAAASVDNTVTKLISGPVQLATPNNVTRIDVCSALEMQSVVMKSINSTDIFIACAAVADYRCKEMAHQKIKKNAEKLTIELIPNPDILANVSKLFPSVFTVGFAAETTNLVEYASQKLTKKNSNMIVANQVGNAETGFNSDTNQVIVLWNAENKMQQLKLPLMSKKQLGTRLINLIIEHYNKTKANSLSRY